MDVQTARRFTPAVLTMKPPGKLGGFLLAMKEEPTMAR
jgi:hypothetical protein